MEKEKIAAFAIIGAIGLILASSLVPSSDIGIAGGVADSGSLAGTIAVFKNGRQVAHSANTVTYTAHNDTAFRLAPKLLSTDMYLNITNITLSNGTTAPAAGDTVCEATIITTNGLSTQQGSIANVTSDIGNYSVAYTWSVTGRSDSIAKVCLQNSTGTWIFASGLLSPTVSVDNGDTLTVTYYLAVS